MSIFLRAGKLSHWDSFHIWMGICLNVVSLSMVTVTQTYCIRTYEACSPKQFRVHTPSLLLLLLVHYNLISQFYFFPCLNCWHFLHASEEGLLQTTPKVRFVRTYISRYVYCQIAS